VQCRIAIDESRVILVSLSLQCDARVRILHSLPEIHVNPMTQVFIAVAVAAGAYLLVRARRHAIAARGIDVGTVSTGWIAEHRREEPR
jgi:hypothetical protein